MELSREYVQLVKIMYLVIVVVAVVVLIGASLYGLSLQSKPANPSSSATPVPSGSSLPSQTSNPTVLPTSTAIPASIAATFNFDSGSPTLTAHKPTPFDQTSNGLTAHFSSTADTSSNPAFSIQTINSLGPIAGVINSQKFSGNFLWPNTVNHDSLNIRFDGSITSITLNFKTAELNDPGPGGTGSVIRISAYIDSSANAVGTPVTARGVESNDLYPEGTLSLNSAGQPFNLVVIDLPSPTGASGFIIDNIMVQTG